MYERSKCSAFVCVPWARLDGVRAGGALRYAGQRPSKFPYPTSDKNANLTKLVYGRLESYCGPR